MKYKYKNSRGDCIHKKNNHFHSKQKMPCVEKGCPYLNECIVKEIPPEEQAKIFFEEICGNEKCKTDGYFDEWVERFRTRHPETYMDEISVGIYKKLIRDGKIIIKEKYGQWKL